MVYFMFFYFKDERLDSKQIEALEEVFKRLSFKTIDLESSQFEDDSTGATLFEILDYYDTCEKLILANNKAISLWGWQSLSKYIRKVSRRVFFLFCLKRRTNIESWMFVAGIIYW